MMTTVVEEQEKSSLIQSSFLWMRLSRSYISKQIEKWLGELYRS